MVGMTRLVYVYLYYVLKNSPLGLKSCVGPEVAAAFIMYSMRERQFRVCHTKKWLAWSLQWTGHA